MSKTSSSSSSGFISSRFERTQQKAFYINCVQEWFRETPQYELDDINSELVPKLLTLLSNQKEYRYQTEFVTALPLSPDTIDFLSAIGIYVSEKRDDDDNDDTFFLFRLTINTGVIYQVDWFASQSSIRIVKIMQLFFEKGAAAATKQLSNDLRSSLLEMATLRKQTATIVGGLLQLPTDIVRFAVADYLTREENEQLYDVVMSSLLDGGHNRHFTLANEPFRSYFLSFVRSKANTMLQTLALMSRMWPPYLRSLFATRSSFASFVPIPIRSRTLFNSSSSLIDFLSSYVEKLQKQVRLSSVNPSFSSGLNSNHPSFSILTRAYVLMNESNSHYSPSGGETYLRMRVRQLVRGLDLINKTEDVDVINECERLLADDKKMEKLKEEEWKNVKETSQSAKKKKENLNLIAAVTRMLEIVSGAAVSSSSLSSSASVDSKAKVKVYTAKPPPQLTMKEACEESRRKHFAWLEEEKLRRQKREEEEKKKVQAEKKNERQKTKDRRKAARRQSFSKGSKY